MVKCLETDLDAVFSALADPTRRAILSRLRAGEVAPVGDIAKLFAISGPAITKHLDVLEGAGLLVRAKAGRQVLCSASPKAMRSAMKWLETYTAFWNERLDALTRHLENKKGDEPWPNPTTPALPSSGASKPPRRRSSPPGRTPRN